MLKKVEKCNLQLQKGNALIFCVEESISIFLVVLTAEQCYIDDKHHSTNLSQKKLRDGKPSSAGTQNNFLPQQANEVGHYTKKILRQHTLRAISHLSFKEPLLDLLNSHGGKQPFKGDCRNNEDVDNCFCLIEIEDRQLKALLSLFFSSYSW